ncbi:MAG: AEC family transporter [Lachnospirales bacterium]
MLNNLFFSINIALPIFLLMITGKMLINKDILTKTFVKNSNTFVFYIGLPIKLCTDMLNTSFDQAISMKFISYVLIGILVGSIFSYGMGCILIKDKTKVGTFTQGAFRGNFLYVGYSLLENIFPAVPAFVPIMVAFTMPMYNILSIIYLILCQGEKINKATLKNMIVSIIKNPLVIAIFIGLVLNMLHFKLPIALERYTGYIKQLVTPLALVTIGATFNFEKVNANTAMALVATFIKLVLIPAVAVVVGYAIDLNTEELLVSYVFFGVPTAASSYIIAISMKGDGELASNIIMYTTLLSIFTITGFIFIFKFIGWI